jgi:hypothetical protein
MSKLKFLAQPNIIRRIVLGIFWRLIGTSKHLLIYLKYNNEIRKFKNIHQNERCFVIGNGPSLTAQDLEKLKNEYTFAANKIFLVFDDTDWRPTYYCIQDFKVIQNDFVLITGKVQAKHKFIAGNTLVLEHTFLQNWIYFYLDIRPFWKSYPKKNPLFSERIERRIYEGCTVTYANIQLAVYMGFKEIYLLGVDHNYSVNRKHDGTIEKAETKDYFTDKYISPNQEFGKQLNLAVLEYSTLAYQSAREYADAHGIKIYNATRGGKLEVFERVDFDTLMKTVSPPPPPQLSN